MSKTSERKTRYLFASAAAVLPTVALFYLMTRLIVPDEGDQIVKQMIDRFELRFQRQERLNILRQMTNNPKIELMPDREEILSARELDEESETSDVPPIGDQEEQAQELAEERIDWLSEARRVVEGSHGAYLEQWLIDKGHVPYRSIMQGSMPSTANPVGASSEEDGEPIGHTYINTYGEREVKISKNCFMQIPRPSMDYFGATGYDSPRIYCRNSEQLDLSFERN